MLPALGEAVLGLNRTSVGLKRKIFIHPAPHIYMPQSNQRGIETKAKWEWEIPELGASIEPAWD